MDRLAAMDAFIRVVDAGSFSGAAKQLHMGQPAVSKAIVQLEERLSVRLLLRTTRQLTPTEAGRDFYERAKRSIEEVDAAEFAARGSATTFSGRLMPLSRHSRQGRGSASGVKTRPSRRISAHAK